MTATPARVGTAATRKVSCPVLPRTTPRPVKPQLKLLSAVIVEENIKEEAVCDFRSSEAGTVAAKVRPSVQPASNAGLFGKVTNKPKLLSAAEKAKTTEAEVKKELKRGSMRDKWGLSLIFNIDGARISLKGLARLERVKVVFIKVFVFQ